jgi:hypothetical protein
MLVPMYHTTWHFVPDDLDINTAMRTSHLMVLCISMGIDFYLYAVLWNS